MLFNDLNLEAATCHFCSYLFGHRLVLCDYEVRVLSAILECILDTPSHLGAILNFIAVVWEEIMMGKQELPSKTTFLK